MQPSKAPPKRKLPRVERDEIIEVHDDENAHLWAVSYSDFLMALLSFFILFFSVDTPQREKIIMNLSQEFSKQNGGGLQNAGPENAGRLPASIIDSIKTLQVKVDKDKEVLIVNFPDDIFRPGEHRMNQHRRELMERFLKIVKVYQGKVNLYFEGHTDSSPLRLHKSAVITDNFVLSSLRASAALQMAKEAGFEEKYLYIQANSSNVRNSRSLSVRVEPRQETL